MANWTPRGELRLEWRLNRGKRFPPRTRMESPQSHDQALRGVCRERCYGCFRPQHSCYCAAIPIIDNKTEVLILQHVRERFHPFNTARIVHKALRNSRLLVDHTPGFAAGLSFKPRAGLLYPGPEATLISDLPREERPEQLVILDGTWHHAKTMVRDVAALRALPRYRLAPAAPSRFRIRREPSATALSTVEATVAALGVLEPETTGLDQLMAAFLLMVEHQFAHPKSSHGWRRNKRRMRHCGNIPAAILADLSSVVVAYGEPAPSERGCERVSQLPVYWAAERLGTGERFACVIQPEFPVREEFLGHLELTQEDFAAALSFEDACASWAAFRRPGDTLAVYNQGTARLLSCISARPTPCLVLKSAGLQPRRQIGTLDDLLIAEGVVAAPAQVPGRAGKRLANVAALVRHFNASGGRAPVDHAASIA